MSTFPKPPSRKVPIVDYNPDSHMHFRKILRVLVVEHNPVNQLITVAMTRKIGCQSIAVGNGKEALDVLRKMPCDLVLMDCQMPEMDGFEAARLIRSGTSEVLNPAVPVIALTASALGEEREKCFEAGMDDYLRKPIDLPDFAGALERWGRKSTKSATPGLINLTNSFLAAR